MRLHTVGPGVRGYHGLNPSFEGLTAPMQCSHLWIFLP